MIRSVVRGFGAALPKRVMTNRDMEEKVDTSDEWIVQRTGIRQRYIAGEGETTASLGEAAARAALDNAGLTPADIDVIILATSTPDNTFPATAVNIQNRLGMHHGAAFDIQAVCSGFVYADGDGRCLYPRRSGQARPGDRRRNLLAHPRLERPHDLRALRRRRRRDCPRRRRKAGDDGRSRHPDGAAAFRRLPQGKALCRRRSVDAPARSAICAWKAARSSSMRSA